MVNDNFLRIDSITRINHTISISFNVSNELKRFFNTFSFEYSCEDAEYIPNSVLVIPFVCNVIPLVWLTDSVLYLKELDSSFYKSIDEFKKGYIQMYPMLSFRGDIQVESLENNEYVPERNLVLFSGGVDALTTTLRHKDENIELLTLWGSADFPLDDNRGWRIQWENIKYNASQLNLIPHYMRTNFYEFIPSWGNDYHDLIGSVGKKEEISWWHEMQHGIGIIGHAAPYAYLYKIGVVYIASSFDNTRKNYTCASDPVIDNYVRFGSSKVVHDAYELTRQKKVQYIVSECMNNNYRFNIHVCLRQYQENNCCECEKCYRTILSLLAEGQDPQRYGFDQYDIRKILYDIKYRFYFVEGAIYYYKQIQNRIIENRENVKEPKLIKWAMNTNLDRINLNYRKILRPYLSAIRLFITNIIKTNEK